MTNSQRKALSTFSDMLLKTAEDTYEQAPVIQQEITNKQKKPKRKKPASLYKPHITNLPPDQYRQLLDAKLMEQYYKSILPASVARAITPSFFGIRNPITLAMQKARVRRILKPIAKAYKIRRKMMEQYYLNNMDNNQPMQKVYLIH